MNHKGVSAPRLRLTPDRRRLDFLYAGTSREAVLGAENWHEERDRLLQLLKGIEAGNITHIEEDGQWQLRATNAENIAVLKERLATLNARIGDNKT